MAAILKKQILKKLARFTKTLTPDDIDLNLSKGIGVLKNLELDAVYISDITNLPPWLEISSIVCDNIKVEVHITRIQTKPIHIVIDSIDVKISVIDEMKLRQKQEVPPHKQSTGSKYGLTEKVLDSMFIEIESINIEFTSTQFRADLEVSGITLKCTDHEFNSCLDNLVKSRPVNNADQSVTIFRQLSFLCIKATARSSLLTKTDSQLIRLNCDSSFINFSMKKKLVDCSHMCSKFIIQLGVLAFILNDSELKEASHFFQHLKQLHELAKIMEQEQIALNPPAPPSPNPRDPEARAGQGLQKLKRRQTETSSPQTHKTVSRKPSTGTNFLQKDEEGKVDISASMMNLQSTFIHEDENIESYQLGKKRIPPALIVQTSIHFRVQKLDVHLCCHTPSSSGEEGLHKLESTHIQLSGIGLDIYPDQKAGSQRHHWANFDYKFQDRTEWGMGLLKETEKKASRVQTGSRLLFMGVSLHKLRESVICFRCVDFSISPVSTGDSSYKQRPFIASDKGSYKFGQDAPTIWIDFTAYFYPATASNSYMIPRPNLYVCINPVQVTFYQDTFLWFIKFVIKMALTLKLGEQEDKQFQKKQKVGELTLIGKNQLKGMDIHIGTLMTKATVPLAYPPEVSVTPDRPVAVQLDVSEIIIQNHTAVSLLDSCQDFVSFLQRLHSSWLLRYHSEYPHTTDDLPLKPTILRDLFTLLHQKQSKGKINFGDMEKMKKTQLWHIELRHFSLSLVSSLTEEGVMRPDEFMEPITINAWVATNIISHLKPLAELAKHLSDQQSEVLNDNPLIYYMVSLPGVVDVNLRQVVFLSLMRLKDTITGLKEEVLSEVRKIDKFSKEGGTERGAEEDPSPLLKISGVVGVDRVCVSLQLPLDLHRSVGIQCDTELSDAALSEMYRARLSSHSSNQNPDETQGPPGRPRSVLHSLDEDLHYEDNQSAFTSSLSSEGSDVMHSDLISLSSSQMNVYDSNAVTMDQLYFAEPDFHQQSFFSSFSHQIGIIPGKRGHSQVVQPLKQKILSVIDLLSTVTAGNGTDVIQEGRVLKRDDVLTYVFRVYINNILVFPEIVGERLRIKGAITKLSFGEEPIEVTEFVDHHNAPRKYAKHLKHFKSVDTRDSPIIKFVVELGSHVEERYCGYSPAPSLSVDARVSGLSGELYAAHIKDIKDVIKDNVTPSPTTVPISVTLQNLNITLAELPGSPDSDIIIGIEALHLVRSPDYTLKIVDPMPSRQQPESVLPIRLRERVLSDDLRDEDTPLQQDDNTSATMLSNSIVSSQSDFTEIDALPEYTQALLDELTETKQKYEITLAMNHSMTSELEDFRSKICSNKEVFNKTFSDVQNLATKNSTLMKQVCCLEDRNRDLENEIADLKIAKRSVETLLKSKVNNLEETKKTTSSYQTELGSSRDKIESLELNKQSLMEILERNSEEIRNLTLRNNELESTLNS